MEFVRDVFVNGFIHWPVPINFGIQIEGTHPQRRRDNQHVKVRDVNRAAFDFGNGAAGGVVPAGVVQLDSKLLLRPVAISAQFDNLFPN